MEINRDRDLPRPGLSGTETERDRVWPRPGLSEMRDWPRCETSRYRDSRYRYMPNWDEIQSESDAEFMEDYALVQEITSVPGDNAILPIACNRHFITDEIIELMVCETNLYAEQYSQTHDSLDWKEGVTKLNKFVCLSVTGSKEHFRQGD